MVPFPYVLDGLLEAHLVGVDQPLVGFDDLAFGFNQLYSTSIKEKLRIELIKKPSQTYRLVPFPHAASLSAAKGLGKG